MIALLAVCIFAAGLEFTTPLPYCASEDGLSCSRTTCSNGIESCHRIQPAPTTSITVTIEDSTITYEECSDYWFYTALILACAIAYLVREAFKFAQCVYLICLQAGMSEAELREVFVTHTYRGPLPIERQLRQQLNDAALTICRPKIPKPVKRRVKPNLVRDSKRSHTGMSWEEIGDTLSRMEY